MKNHNRALWILSFQKLKTRLCVQNHAINLRPVHICQVHVFQSGVKMYCNCFYREHINISESIIARSFQDILDYSKKMNPKLITCNFCFMQVTVFLNR